jgi:hypothetical protein
MGGGYVHIGAPTLKSVKSVKQRFSENKKMYLTPLNERIIYIALRTWPKPFMEVINGYRKMAK